MWKRIQRTSDLETPPQNSQRWIPGAVQRLPKSISDQVATEAASNGPWRGATISLPGVLLHLQDQTAAQWASAQAFGKLMMTKLVNYFRLALPSVQSTVSQCQARAKQRGVLRLAWRFFACQSGEKQRTTEGCGIPQVLSCQLHKWLLVRTGRKW